LFVLNISKLVANLYTNARVNKHPKLCGCFIVALLYEPRLSQIML